MWILEGTQSITIKHSRQNSNLLTSSAKMYLIKYTTAGSSICPLLCLASLSPEKFLLFCRTYSVASIVELGKTFLNPRGNWWWVWGRPTNKKPGSSVLRYKRWVLCVPNNQHKALSGALKKPMSIQKTIRALLYRELWAGDTQRAEQSNFRIKKEKEKRSREKWIVQIKSMTNHWGWIWQYLKSAISRRYSTSTTWQFHA